jgi:DNA-binding NtrC family response regulator
VERGTFRRDLYYRLNVVTLRLAPLRERVDDIPPLVQHFLDRHGKGHVVAAEVMDMLTSYDWPGNVRELENCVQQMVALHSGAGADDNRHALGDATLPSPARGRPGHGGRSWCVLLHRSASRGANSPHA